MQPTYPDCFMIVILAANVRILIRRLAGKIPQHKAKNHFLFAWLCFCVYAASRLAVLRVAEMSSPDFGGFLVSPG